MISLCELVAQFLPQPELFGITEPCVLGVELRKFLTNLLFHIFDLAQSFYRDLRKLLMREEFVVVRISEVLVFLGDLDLDRPVWVVEF